MAFWYQMMLAQQNPMAWTAAMMGQGQQNANSSSQLPPMPTSAQVSSLYHSYDRES